MPETLPGLPDPVRPEPFTAAAPDAAVARGRSLRRRRAGVLVGGTGVVAGTVLAVLLSGGAAPSQAVLVPGQSGSPTSSTETIGVALPAPTTSRPARTAPVAPESRSSAQPAAPVGPRPRSTPSPTRTARPQPGAIAGPAFSFTAYDSSRKCDGSGPTRAQGYCSYYDGATSGRRGQRVELAASVCRLPALGTGTLQADDGHYAQFNAGNDAGRRWDWEHGKRFVRQGRTWSVPAGSCLRFRVAWDLRDNAGRLLPRGAYTLQAYPLVAPTGPATPYVAVSAVQGFTIT